ncbi:unnamed protein product [Amaranthus hypochondriacus]
MDTMVAPNEQPIESISNGVDDCGAGGEREGGIKEKLGMADKGLMEEMGRVLTITNDKGVPPPLHLPEHDKDDEEEPPGFESHQHKIGLATHNTHETTEGPYFNIGIQSKTPRKTVKIRSRKVGKKSDEVGKGSDFTDSHSKRKAWEMDVEMVDSDSLMKRSCIGEGLAEVLEGDSTVAEVGENQPRERQ